MGGAEKELRRANSVPVHTAELGSPRQQPDYGPGLREEVSTPAPADRPSGSPIGNTTFSPVFDLELGSATNTPQHPHHGHPHQHHLLHREGHHYSPFATRTHRETDASALAAVAASARPPSAAPTTTTLPNAAATAAAVARQTPLVQRSAAAAAAAAAALDRSQSDLQIMLSHPGAKAAAAHGGEVLSPAGERLMELCRPASELELELSRRLRAFRASRIAKPVSAVTSTGLVGIAASTATATAITGSGGVYSGGGGGAYSGGVNAGGGIHSGGGGVHSGSSPPGPAPGEIEALATELLSAGFVVQVLDGTRLSKDARSCLRTLKHRFLVCLGWDRPASAGAAGAAGTAVSTSTFAGAAVGLRKPGQQGKQGEGEQQGQGGQELEQVLQEPLVVEVRFREQFLIANPTRGYEHLLLALPVVFVGPLRRLDAAVELVAAEVAAVFRQAGRPLPPWRTKGAMLSKWAPEQLLDIGRLMQQQAIMQAAAVASRTHGSQGQGQTDHFNNSNNDASWGSGTVTDAGVYDTNTAVVAGAGLSNATQLRAPSTCAVVAGFCGGFGFVGRDEGDSGELDQLSGPGVEAAAPRSYSAPSASQASRIAMLAAAAAEVAAAAAPPLGAAEHTAEEEGEERAQRQPDRDVLAMSVGRLMAEYCAGGRAGGGAAGRMMRQPDFGGVMLAPPQPAVGWPVRAGGVAAAAAVAPAEAADEDGGAFGSAVASGCGLTFPLLPDIDGEAAAPPRPLSPPPPQSPQQPPFPQRQTSRSAFSPFACVSVPEGREAEVEADAAAAYWDTVSVSADGVAAGEASAAVAVLEEPPATTNSDTLPEFTLMHSTLAPQHLHHYHAFEPSHRHLGAGGIGAGGSGVPVAVMAMPVAVAAATRATTLPMPTPPRATAPLHTALADVHGGGAADAMALLNRHQQPLAAGAATGGGTADGGNPNPFGAHMTHQHLHPQPHHHHQPHYQQHHAQLLQQQQQHHHQPIAAAVRGGANTAGSVFALHQMAHDMLRITRRSSSDLSRAASKFKNAKSLLAAALRRPKIGSKDGTPASAASMSGGGAAAAAGPAIDAAAASHVQLQQAQQLQRDGGAVRDNRERGGSGSGGGSATAAGKEAAVAAAAAAASAGLPHAQPHHHGTQVALAGGVMTRPSADEPAWARIATVRWGQPPVASAAGASTARGN